MNFQRKWKRGIRKIGKVVVTWNQRKRKFLEGAVRCLRDSYEVEDWGEACGDSICEDHAAFRESCFSQVVGEKTKFIVDWGGLFPFFKVGETWTCWEGEAKEMRDGERYRWEEGEIHGGRSKSNSGDMVRNKGMSGGINLERERHPLALRIEGGCWLNIPRVCGV